MKKFLKDFKAFISKGNVLDLAIGVVIGGAFGKIVTSLVNDIIMPLIALLLGGKSMSGLVIVLNNEPLYLTDGVTINPQALTWNYGSFIQTIIDFLIIAFCVFLIVHMIMKARALTEKNNKILEPVLEVSEFKSQISTEELLTEIRDLLKEKKNTNIK